MHCNIKNGGCYANTRFFTFQIVFLNEQLQSFRPLKNSGFSLFINNIGLPTTAMPVPSTIRQGLLMAVLQFVNNCPYQGLAVL